KMEFAIFAAEIEQWVTARFEYRLEHAPDENEMVAAIVHRIASAFKARQGSSENRRAIFAHLPRGETKAILSLACKAVRGRLLANLKHIDSKTFSIAQAGRAPRAIGDADEQQGRIEGDRREAVRGQPDRAAVGAHCGHNGHTRGKAAERIAKGARIAARPIFRRTARRAPLEEINKIAAERIGAVVGHDKRAIFNLHQLAIGELIDKGGGVGPRDQFTDRAAHIERWQRDL